MKNYTDEYRASDHAPSNASGRKRKARDDDSDILIAHRPRKLSPALDGERKEIMEEIIKETLQERISRLQDADTDRSIRELYEALKEKNAVLEAVLARAVSYIRSLGDKVRCYRRMVRLDLLDGIALEHVALSCLYSANFHHIEKVARVMMMIMTIMMMMMMMVMMVRR